MQVGSSPLAVRRLTMVTTRIWSSGRCQKSTLVGGESRVVGELCLDILFSSRIKNPFCMKSNVPETQYWKSEGIASLVFNLTLDWGNWPPCSGRLEYMENSPVHIVLEVVWVPEQVEIVCIKVHCPFRVTKPYSSVARPLTESLDEVSYSHSLAILWFFWDVMFHNFVISNRVFHELWTLQREIIS